jgi:hemoglobin-like flavoprotein
MGCYSSKKKEAYGYDESSVGFTNMHKRMDHLQRITSIPIEVAVAHFTPSNFPLMPVINKKTSGICGESWKIIMSNETKDEFGGSISGIASFYNDFYERLELFDSSGRFEAVLTRHSSDSNKIAAKGAILIRIIQYVLKIEKDNDETQLLLYMLGKSHSQKAIRPWQYSIFIQTLLITIASRLGVHASNGVMEAWVNLFAFVMKSMLPPAIVDQVVETELNINTSSEFDSGRVAEEVKIKEEEKEVRKKLRNPRSDGQSSEGGYTDRSSQRGSTQTPQIKFT